MYKTEWYNTMNRLLKLIVMTLLCIMAVSCNSKFNMAGKEQKFNWMPTVAAPYNYPIEIKYAFVGYGSEGKEYPVMDRTVHKGLGVPGGGLFLWQSFRIPQARSCQTASMCCGCRIAKPSIMRPR